MATLKFPKHLESNSFSHGRMRTLRFFDLKVGLNFGFRFFSNIKQSRSVP
jgi:hypothetical protein